MTVRLRPEAQRDVQDAARWYEDREAGLGAAVVEEVGAAFRRIDTGPERYPVSYRGLRRALVRRFPYAIYYTDIGNEIVVIAVLHQRRDLEIIGGRSRD